nr:uncharacterized protein K02A2.6-like [Misgurnus anguillicaudatus]
MEVISPVQYSEWATPVVPVIKKDGSVRLCGDFKVTLNPAICVDHYPIPRIEDLFASLAGGQLFSKLDLSSAYLQMPVAHESRKLLTISTHKGLFVYNRLPFGIAPAPALFQKAMDQILLGIPNTHCYLDDILITGRNNVEHLKTLDQVLTRLEEYGLRLQREKCEFFKQSLEYLGHYIDAAGLHKSSEKIKAIMEAPAPTNVSQLRSFLGMINYYGRFIPNLASLLNPLNALLCKDKKWCWSVACEQSFQEVKDILTSPAVLTHYDPALPIRLACDASPYGVGAVISHVCPDGEEKPIAFASRTLSKAEQNYAQIEREALSIIFGIRKFHQYLYGRRFTLFTDHQPLTAILSPNKSIPSMAAARMQRWALILAAHDYVLEYKKAALHANADGLSRLPLPVTHTEKTDTVDVFYAAQIATLPVSSAEIRRDTLKDPSLSPVLDMVSTGRFPKFKEVPQGLLPFVTRRNELTVVQGCLMWGSRVVVPTKLRNRVLADLHLGHPGVVRMKHLARSYVWWPGIDGQIESQSKTCQSCQRIQNAPCPAPLHPWVWPAHPWERIHVDFAGPFEGHMYFIVVDAHSKWPEVSIMDSTTTSKTIQVLRGLFSRYGIPNVIVSDNGPQFCAEEFSFFLKANGVQHIRSAPYHPSSNGQAERFVQTFKHALKASKGSAPIQQRLDGFLLTYRNTPHATTKESPAMLFLNRKLRTRLDLLKPSLAKTVSQSQDAQQLRRQKHSKFREFHTGESVLARDYRKGGKWMPGVVMSKTGPVSYMVNVGASGIWKRHVDQLLKHGTESSENQMEPEVPAGPDPFQAPLHQENIGEKSGNLVKMMMDTPGSGNIDKSTPETVQTGETIKRYPTRLTRPPDRYQAF